MTRDETPNPPPPARDLLAIDVGNSRVKLGWFRGVDGECLDRAQSATLPIAGPRTPEPIATLAGSLEELTAGRLAEWLGATADREQPPAIVIASVCAPADRGLADLLGEWFSEELTVQRLASERLPITLRVDEPERIGVDRVVAAIAANRLRRPETPAIVIDIGTAITVDLVAADGVLEGGAILPGPRLAAAALGEATDRLPQVDFGDLDASPDAVGRSTEPAIRAGLYWGSVGAVRELIARQSDRLTKTPQVFVTGGAAPAFARLLGGPDVSVRHVPHLTLSGVAIAAGRVVVTVVRVLTPVGRGAIAVVEVAGPDAVAMVEARFEPAGGRPLADGPIDAIRFGRWRASDNASDSGEELVVVRTAEDRVEVHCHGGVAASAAIIAALSASGATTEASRAPVSIADDAHRLLAEAPTERVAGLLLDQANGALKAAIDSALGALESGDVEPAQLLLEHLLLHERLALHGVVAPWRVVLAGPPNAGKSSLKNALVGYERAIVYDQPGTTRDVVTTTTAIGGWPVQLADTAGVRETDDPLEAAGVRLAEQALAAADVAVVVCEAAAFESDHSAAARERLVFATPQEVARIDVASKADLGPSPLAIDPPAIVTSVKTGRGLAELTAAIERAICPTTPAAGDAIPFRAEHVGQLQRAAERLPNDPAAAKAALQALLASEVPSD